MRIFASSRTFGSLTGPYPVLADLREDVSMWRNTGDGYTHIVRGRSFGCAGPEGRDYRPNCLTAGATGKNQPGWGESRVGVEGGQILRGRATRDAVLPCLGAHSAT